MEKRGGRGREAALLFSLLLHISLFGAYKKKIMLYIFFFYFLFFYGTCYIYIILRHFYKSNDKIVLHKMEIGKDEMKNVSFSHKGRA
jgi:hypothetical protein